MLSQRLLNGIVDGMLLAIPALGFNAIYAVLRFPNFAIGVHATIGAYAGFVLNVILGWPILAAFVGAFVVAGVIGAVDDTAILRPLRARGALAAAIASIALAICLENVIRFLFGNGFHSYNLPVYRDWTVGGVHVGPQQLENVAVAVVTMAAIFAFLAVTTAGKAMRAVADNPMLAAVKGIDPDRIALVVNFVGMGLAGLGGMLLALDTSISPLTALEVVLPIFAACVVGGLGNIPGAVLGALVIGVAEDLSSLAFAPAYRSGVGFVAILLVLFLRPRGLLGTQM